MENTQPQRYILSAERWQQLAIYLGRARELWMPIGLAVGWSMFLLLGMYARPLALVHDVGSRFETISGLYSPEHNREFSYAYTRGDATVRFPQIGEGGYIIQLRMGGPGGAAPLPAQLIAGVQLIDLGRVQQIRNYRLLVETDTSGTIQLRLHSGLATIAGDYRQLGVLLDRLEARSVGPTLPSSALVLSMLFVLALAAGVVSQRAAPYRGKVALLLFVATVLGVVGGFGRGRLGLDTLWSFLVLSLLAALALRLGDLGVGWFARPLYGVAALFLAWRVTLWFVAGVGMQYAELLRPLEQIVEQENTLYEAYGNLARSLLVSSWVHWDSTHYISIASTGYEFYGQQWPNMAFFPLYPLLTRAIAPLAGYDTVLAAVLATNMAFVAALLLLYNLLAHDFGPTVAYRSLLLLLVFPTSAYFAAAYSESLALLLLVLAIWALRRQRWWLAGAAGFGLALARLPGVLIAPILALAYLSALGWRWRAIRAPILAALLPPAGLGLFMLYQWQRFGTPFAFMIAQRQWKNHLSPPWVMPIELYNQIFVYGNWPMAAFQSIFWVGFVVLMIAALRRLPWLYSLTLLLFLLPPYLSSWPWSISRHVLLGFPAFVVLAQWAERPRLRQILIVGMLVLQVVATVLFVNGFLVA